MLQAFKTKLI